MIDNTFNNQSDLILIEQMSTQKSKFDEITINNDEKMQNFSYLGKTDLNPLCDDTYVSGLEENKNFPNNNDTENNFVHNENKKNTLNIDLTKNTDSTLKYESEEDSNVMKDHNNHQNKVETCEEPDNIKNLNIIQNDKLDQFRINSKINEDSNEKNHLSIENLKLENYIFKQNEHVSSKI
jgi:hypothetical protein